MFKTYHLITFTLFVFAFSYLYSVNSAVIGLDLGNEFMKISSISPGKSFYIVEDTTTKRKTPTSIAFYSNERIYEYDTYAKRPKAYQTTFTGLPKFLGKSLNDPKLAEQSKFYHEDYQLEEDERGTVAFKLKNFKMGSDDETDYKLKIEELFGMIFRHVKDLTTKQTGRVLRDIVVTVPPFWNLKERYALYDSLVLADLNPLAFISENTAAALYYALERQDNVTHTAIIYNLGSSSLQVSLIEFFLSNSTDKVDKGAQVETYRVLAEAWDQDVGGMAIDLNLLHYLAREFDSKPGRAGQKSILTSNPAKAKLLREVNRLKEVLSANKQASIYIENLFESTDLKATIDRATFEEINKDLFQKLTKPIEEVLVKAGKTINDVDVIELIGGGIRVPKVQQILNDYLPGKEVGTHLNGDESMALGAAFHAANLSASFKTRPIYVNDGYNFDIRVELRDLEPVESTEGGETGLNKEAVLFPYKTRFGSKKILAFDHSGDVNCSFYAQLTGSSTEERLVSFGVSGLKEALEDPKYKDKDLGAPKLNLHFRLSPLGFVELSKAEATIEEIVLYEEPVKNATATKASNSTTNTSAEADTEDTAVETEVDQDTETSVESNTESTSESSQEPDRKFKKKTVTHHIPLKIETRISPPGPMTEEELETSRDLLAKFDHYEEQKKKTAEAKNRLEAALYSTRDHLEEEHFTQSSKEEEKEELKKLLEEHNEWLYSDEAYSANHLPFHTKFEEMHKVVSKVLHRIEQREKRPEFIEKAKDAIKDLTSRVHDLAETRPWITEEARNKVIAQFEQASTWLTQMIEKQEELLHHDDPVLTTTEIASKVEKLRDAFTRLRNTVKPTPPKNGTNSTFGDSFSAQFGKDGKFDEGAFKEYMKKMNITWNGTKSETGDGEGSENETEGENIIGGDEVEDQKQTPEEPEKKPEVGTSEGVKTETKGDEKKKPYDGEL